MTNGETAPPVNLLLSRDELLLTLGALETEFLPGLDADPLGELTAEQQSLALTVAGRGLMARELARLNEEGTLILHNSLLTAVGVCAYSQNAVFVYRWRNGNDTPARFFGHLQAELAVTHTRPQEVLHLFSLLSREQLIDQIVAESDLDDVTGFAGELTVSGADFANARERAAAGDVPQATRLLGGGDASPAAAKLAEALASGPDIAIFQTLTQEADGAVTRGDFTLVRNGSLAWLIAAGVGEGAPLNARAATSETLRALLAEAI